MATDVVEVNISHLPNELMVEIFSYLSVEDLAVNVQFVCNRWLQLSSQDVLWKNSSFRAGNKHSFEYIDSFLEKAPKLRSFFMYKATNKIINNLANYSKDLREITIIELWDVNNADEAFAKLFIECKKLEDITLPCEILFSETLATLVGELENLHSISVKGVSPQSVILKPIADGCPSLRHLDVCRMTWDYPDVKYFLEKKKDSLLTLRISNETMSTREHALPLITMCGNTLQTLELDVRSYNFYPVSITDLKKLTGLTSLHISNLKGVPADLMADLFMGKTMSQLVELKIEVSGSKEDSTLVNIICLNCPNLVKLGLKGCYALKDDGLQYLYECLNLKELDISYCFSLKSGATEHICRCSNLRYLNIGPWPVLENVLGHVLPQSKQNHIRALLCEREALCIDMNSLRLRCQKNT